MKSLFVTFAIVLLASATTFAAGYYWVGGSGNWADYASHWATTSGGATFHTQAPTQNDHVYFDANSFTAAGQKVTINVNAVCADMSWTGALYSPELIRDATTTRTLSIHGSLTLITAMNFNFLGVVYFESIASGKTITSAEQSFKHNVHFNNVGGWKLLDGFLQTGNYTVYLVKGTLDLNDMPFTVNIFNSNYTNVRMMKLGDSIVTITSTSSSAFYFRGENLTFQCDSSLVRFTSANAGLNHYGPYGPGLTFNNVIFEAGTGSSTVNNGSGTFNNLTFNSIGSVNGANAIDTLTFTGGGTIGTDGNNMNVVVFNSTATINGNGTYGAISMSGNGEISGNNTIGMLTLASGKVYTFTSGKTQMITGTLSAGGSCASPIKIQSSSETSQTTISKSSGAVSITYCALKGVNASGGATFTANNTVDLGNNSGWAITQPTPKNLYWIGGTGNWNDQTKWSVTSGGAPVNCIPNALDNVFFDANSFGAAGQTVTVIGDQDNTAYCRNMTWTGATNNPTLAGASTQTLRIYGSLTLIPGISFTFAGPVYFAATEIGKTITTAGILLDNNHVYFDGAGGEWTLSDGLNLGDRTLYLVSGSLITNNQPVNTGLFNTIYTTARALTLGSSEMTISSTSSVAFYFRGDNFTFNAGTSTIRFTGIGADLEHYLGNGPGLAFNQVIFQAATGSSNVRNAFGSFNTLTFNSIGSIDGGNTIGTISFAGEGTINASGNNFSTVVFNGAATINGNGTYGHVTMNGDGSILGNNTFGTLILSAGKQYTLTYGKTQIIQTALTANGTETQLIVIKSSQPGSQSTFSKTSGAITVSYVSLQDNNATGGTTFTANNAVNLGNNTGWTINALVGKNYYWVGGTGNYNDANEWSLTSGGAGGAGIPTSVDNVFFDANSFTAPGQVVTVIGDASSNARAMNMDWTGATNNPTLAGASTQTLRIHGSLTFIPGISFTFAGPVYFAAAEIGKTITTAGVLLDNNDVYFDGLGGEWTLSDGLNLGDRTLYLAKGSLITNNQPVNTGLFNARYETTRALTLGSSEMTISSTSSYAFYFRGENFTFNAGTSTIRFTGIGADLEHYGPIGPGLAFNHVIFQAATGTSYVTNASGSFNTLTFNSNGSISRGNTIGTLTFSGTGTINDNGNNFSTVVFNGAATINGNGTYGHVTMNSNGAITGSNTFGTLILSAGKQYTLTYGKTQTIQTALTANGTETQLIVIKSSQTGSQSTFSKTSGAVTVSYVSLQDNNATGGATFTANNAVNLGNNTGWTINASGGKNYYWVGGTGNYNDANEWSLTSGGAGGAGVPTAVDNVFFDANSFTAPAQVVTLIGDASNIARAMNMNWTGATNNPTLAGASTQTLYIHGSLTFIPGISFTFAGPVYFAATQTGNTITTAGVLLDNNDVYFDGVGGEWTLSDGLSLGDRTLYLVSGSLITNNQPVNTGLFNAKYTTARALTLGSSEMTISSTSNLAFYFRGENFNFNAGTSTIRFTGIGADLDHYGPLGPGLAFNHVIFQAATGTSAATNASGSFNTLTFNSHGSVSGGNTINTLSFAGNGTLSNSVNVIGTAVFHADGTIQGSNTFGTLEFTPGHTYTLSNGQTQTINNTFVSNGTCSASIVIQSSSATLQSNISKASGAVAISHCNLQQIKALGGATFSAQNSVDLGGNSGWSFTVVPQDLYWVGGTGNWDDVNHWSATSGGASGYCLPTQSDNLFFDQNSFSQTSQAVYINVANAECRDMNWSSVGFSPTFTTTSSTNNLKIYGSLTLNQNMNFAFSGSVYFEGQTPSGPAYSITSAGKNFNNTVYFNGIGGIWTLQDAFSVSGNDLYLNFGTLNTNGRTVNIGRFISTNNNTRALNMGSSVITVNANTNLAWYVTGVNFTIVPGTSEIRFAAANGGLYSTGASNLSYHKILFQNAGGTSTLRSNHNFNYVVFNPAGTILEGGSFGTLVMNSGGLIQDNSAYGSASFYGNTTINGNNTFGRLLLGAGSTCVFQSGKTQTISGRFIIWGTAANPIYIRSSVDGTQATISKSAGTVLGNYIHLKDMAATGGATFNVYSSVDLGNNTGWIFLAPTSVTFPDTNIPAGPAVCYEATETITMGGDGKFFTVQNGGIVKLIAGYAVHFLPGTRVFSGGYLNAYITPYGFFCDTISTMPVAQDVLAVVPEEQNPGNDRSDSFFRIYPNPSSGKFTLELKEPGSFSDINIEIFTSMGERIQGVVIQSGMVCHIDLADRKSGIYLLRVTRNNRTDVEKLIKH